MDEQDNRSLSFLHLLSLLETVKIPPSHIFLENVQGFDGSQAHRRLLEVRASSDDLYAFRMLSIPESMKGREWGLGERRQSDHFLDIVSIERTRLFLTISWSTMTFLTCNIRRSDKIAFAVHPCSSYSAVLSCAQTLSARGFDVEQYLLSPVQLGIPNSRLRYYCLASRRNTDGAGKVTAVTESVPQNSLLRQDGGAVPLRPLYEYLVRCVTR